jgi:hypothetical protein
MHSSRSGHERLAPMVGDRAVNRPSDHRLKELWNIATINSFMSPPLSYCPLSPISRRLLPWASDQPMSQVPQLRQPSLVPEEICKFRQRDRICQLHKRRSVRQLNQASRRRSEIDFSRRHFKMYLNQNVQWRLFNVSNSTSQSDTTSSTEWVVSDLLLQCFYRNLGPISELLLSACIHSVQKQFVQAKSTVIVLSDMYVTMSMRQHEGMLEDVHIIYKKVHKTAAVDSRHRKFA